MSRVFTPVARVAAVASLVTLAGTAGTSFAAVTRGLTAPSASALFTRALAHEPKLESGQALELDFEGRVELEAHFERPHAVRTYHSRDRFRLGADGSIRRDWTTWADGDTSLDPETWLVAGNRVYHREGSHRPWSELTGDAAGDGAALASAGVPWPALSVARGQSGARASKRGHEVAIPAMLDGRSRTVHLDAATGDLDSIDCVWAHPREGDVRDVAATTAWIDRRGLHVPGRLRLVVHRADDGYRVAETLASGAIVPAGDSVWAAPDPASLAPSPPEPVPAPVQFDSVAAGAWTATLPDRDTRSLVVEFRDHLAVIETSGTVEAGERLDAAVRRQFPGKPIRFVMFGHHHPDYTGGLRPFIADGVRVVTMPGNADYVREIAAAPFTLAPDRLARAPRPLALEVVRDGRWLDADASQSLMAVDIGAHSNHTAEYLVFYLPRSKFLFEGDLGWYHADDGATRAGRRAQGLLDGVRERGLDVERYAQSWPASAPAIVGAAELDSLVAARAKH